MAHAAAPLLRARDIWALGDRGHSAHAAVGGPQRQLGGGGALPREHGALGGVQAVVVEQQQPVPPVTHHQHVALSDERRRGDLHVLPPPLEHERAVVWLAQLKRLSRRAAELAHLERLVGGEENRGPRGVHLGDADGGALGKHERTLRLLLHRAWPPAQHLFAPHVH
eukprot:CAMPEP_0184387572 /NCGR_PEP_ID=MMETSP0007-20130409/10857_1 /TAXON_ID=97485 /ORGANISM="Prymnesium parvum, Strain Texoma1" /LENGTH=166 /DNA_ID=CAMNT_0026736041 /DNA_START=477 /DNA_END=977 /DNA_ORIENTATION=-